MREVTVGISIYLKGVIRNILHFYATECAWMCVLPQQCQNTYEKAFTFFSLKKFYSPVGSQ